MNTSKMNKSIVGWIIAIVIFVVSLGVIVGGGLYAKNLNESLVKTSADLTSAKQTLAQNKTDLEKANSSITKLTAELKDSQDQTTQVQASLDTLTSAKTTLETKYNAMWCKNTASFDYSDKQKTLDAIVAYAINLGYAINGPDASLSSELQGLDNVWLVRINANKVGQNSVPLDLFVFPSQKATLFGTFGCWVELAK
jgi:hypothetical protein